MPKVAKTLLSVPVHADKRGKLAVVEAQREVPFPIARFFAITDVPRGVKRGQHAHRTCSEMLFVVRGQVTVTVESVAGKAQYQLTPTSGAVLLEPMTWVEMFDFSSDAVFVCLASERHLPAEYIFDYDEFQRHLGRRAAS